MDGTRREQIHPGSQVQIVLKKDQRSGTLTKGIVKDILTKSPFTTMGSRSAWRVVRLDASNKSDKEGCRWRDGLKRKSGTRI